MANVVQVVQAFDRAPITDVPSDDANAIEQKLARAHQGQQKRSAHLKPHERMKILQSAAVALEKNQDKFATLIAREGGKPWPDAVVEVVRATDGLKSAAEELRNFGGREIPMGLSAASDGRWAFTVREPIGVVAALSAFNHPLNLIVHQVAPAVATGCPVIIKPSQQTPLCCIELVKILHEAGLPEALCQTFVTNDTPLAERLAVDPRVSFLSFIGSAKVGWSLRGKIAPGTRCALEHGGAAPVIVDKTAKLDSTVESIVKGGYYHAGQVCVSVQRVFVHESIIGEFQERLAARVKKLRTGDPVKKDTEVGPLIHPKETERVTEWIAEAQSGGAKVLGGGRLSETTLLPSVLVNPPADAKVSTLEIFGPVTCLYPFTDLERAIATANSLPLAFQAAIFTSELEPALSAARKLDAGTVLINDHTAFRTDWMPFAGHRQSGYGTGGIPATMRDMTHEKMVVFRYGS